MVDRQNLEAKAKKKRKDEGKNSLSIEDDIYYDNDIYGTDPDYNNNYNLIKD